jgi:hypothetical protein
MTMLYRNISLKETLEDLHDALIRDYHYNSSDLENDYSVSIEFDNYYEMVINYKDGKVRYYLIDDYGDIVKVKTRTVCKADNIKGVWMLCYDDNVYTVTVE